MANIKEIFDLYERRSMLASKSCADLDPGIESPDWIRAAVKSQQEVEINVDFSDPANFARYGSAEQYYKDAFLYIQHEYPYDGSGKEQLAWEITGSSFDRYIFKEEYPRTNGYINMGVDYGFTTPIAGPGEGWDVTSHEYIEFFGGPHTSDAIQAGEAVSHYFNPPERTTPGPNIYNEPTDQQSNLEIDLEKGAAVEFWLKKSSWAGLPLESRRQTIVDIWNTGSTPGIDQGRIMIGGLFDPALAGGPITSFDVYFYSGSDGWATPTSIGQNLDLTGSTWHHYGFSFTNIAGQLQGRLYVDGELNDTVLAHTSITSPITGAMVGRLGSLISELPPGVGGGGAVNRGKLSGSLDEFRFWKSSRSGRDIGQNWFTQINGGTNTDYLHQDHGGAKYSFTNPVDLGVYYKFNEGIINPSHVNRTDQTVLDYSGRISNGTWEGYSVGSRNTGSAIVEAKAAKSEFKNPILYSHHPLVLQKSQELYLKGFNHDINNNAAIYQSIPSWIQDEDSINDRHVLLKLIQIISSYFDSLQLQIQELPRLKDIDYISGSYYKPLPFSNRLVDGAGLTSTELFAKATAMEALASRDDFREFAAKLDETKNKIYKNIYNNLVYIFKSKGTEKSIRNLIRCYGIGNELVKLNLYANQTTFDLKENYESSITRKRYANFFTTASFEATVYQSASLSDVNVQPFLSSSENTIFNGQTFETEILFPLKPRADDISFIYTPFLTSSLFGLHTYDVSNPDDPAWLSPDVANFQVRAVRQGQRGKDAYFELTSSAGGIFPTLTSSLQKDVYDNSKWNLAVRIKPQSYPLAGYVDGALTPDYDIEFVGYNVLLDTIENQFSVTSSVSFAEGNSFLTSSKRAYIGAHRTNFTGSVLERSDAKISSVRYWFDYIEDKAILAHAKDPSSFGRLHPGRNTFLNQSGEDFGEQVTEVPQIETLALQWNFDTVTGSDASGEFIVEDYSSGSTADTLKYGWMGPLAKIRHPGRGINFPENNTRDVAVREYVYTAKQQPPEVINSSDMVEIKSEGDIEIFHRDSRPVRFFFALEKSMYGIVSSEMLKLFATVLDFNNLIGEPVNRYRQDYKALEKMRQIFFERVENPTMDFEKFVDYYKWVDEAILHVASQLFPVTANFSRKVFAVLESHVLERNKYWNKFPTLEMKFNDPEAGLYGINEMLYPYERGSAPIPISQSVHCVWANERAEREVFSSGNPIIDEQRNTFRDANDFRPSANPPVLTDIAGVLPVQYQGSTYALRNFTKIYRFAAKEMPSLHGGSNVARIKNVQYAHAELPFGSTTQLKVNLSEIEDNIDCDDVINPSAKVKLRYKLTNNPNSYKSGRGDIFAPWSLYSSSVDSGYAAQVAASFSAGIDITNYHDDVYGDDKAVPMQGPFTEKYVGGREYRHVPILTPSDARPEAWNLDFPLPVDQPGTLYSTGSVVWTNLVNMATFHGAAPCDGEPGFIFRQSSVTDCWANGEAVSANGAVTYRAAFTAWHEVYAGLHTSVGSPGDEDLIAYCFFFDAATMNQVEIREAGSDPTGGSWSGALNTTDFYRIARGSCGTVFYQQSTDAGATYSTVYTSSVKTEDDLFPVVTSLTFASNLNGLCEATRHSGEGGFCGLTLTARTIHQPRSTLLREPLAKRPVNIRNIRQTTGSTIIGNYTHDYEIVQTSDRRINNRFFVKNGGFSPTIATSSFIPGVVDYELPDFSTYGKTKWIFVERFNAPGGPEVSSRGAMDIDSEQYAVYNDLNLRNSIVRNALKKWQTSYNGQFGIDSSRQVAVNGSPFGVIIGPGEPEGFRQPRVENYNTLASYHKTPRNAASRGLYKSDYSREIEWVKLDRCTLSNFNRTLTGPPVGGNLADQAESNQILETTGYFEFEIFADTFNIEPWAVGISSGHRQAVGPITSPILWDYTFLHNVTPPSDMVEIWEGDINSGVSFAAAVGDRLRIFKDKSTVIYQHLPLGTDTWINKMTSLTASSGNYYPRAAFDETQARITNARISNPRYDNWFIQHPIPQDELQYSWINDSYDHTKDQPFGLVGSPDGGRTNFTTPSGSSSSIATGEIQFISSSNWNWPGGVINFVNMWSPLGGRVFATANAPRQRYTLSSSTNTLIPGYGYTQPPDPFGGGVNLPEAINSYLNNINGPYGYPSWKQIRTGETPVARHQKQNNIITVGERSRTLVAREKLEQLRTIFGTAKAVQQPWYRDNTKTTRYIEPMVTFKYMPLWTNLINSGPSLPLASPGAVAFRHSFCNNLYYFANNKLTEDFGLKTYNRENPEYSDRRGPIALQMQDLFLAQYEADPAMLDTLYYSEVVYPKEIFTGLAETRGRTKYEEDAPTSLQESISQPIEREWAVADYGTNGIDRNSSERRSFWSDTW